MAMLPPTDYAVKEAENMLKQALQSDPYNGDVLIVHYNLYAAATVWESFRKR